jgi:hypothetical protein
MTSVGPIVVGIDGTPRSRDALVLAGKLADPGQRLLLTHVHDYSRLSTLLANGEYERLVRDVADATFAAVQETLADAVERELRLVSDDSIAGARGHDGRFDDRRRLLAPLGSWPCARRERHGIRARRRNGPGCRRAG